MKFVLKKLAMKIYLQKSLVVLLGTFLFLFSCLNSNALAQTTYTPPSQSATALTGIPFDQAVPLDETYRKEFDKCDTSDTFKGKAINVLAIAIMPKLCSNFLMVLSFGNQN
jgi:hypothetical protein